MKNVPTNIAVLIDWLQTQGFDVVEHREEGAHNRLLVPSEAEAALQIGRFNPHGPTSSPEYRAEVDATGVEWDYTGDVEGGTGVEHVTREELKWKSIEALDP